MNETETVTKPVDELEQLEQRRIARKEKFEADQLAGSALRDLEDARALESAEDRFGVAFEYGEDEDKCTQKIAAVKTVEGLIIVKRPAPPVHKKYMASKFTPEDGLELLRSTLVHPSRERLMAIFNEQPGAIDRATKAVAMLAGARFKEVLGK